MKSKVLIDPIIQDELKQYEENVGAWQIPSKKWKRRIAFEFIPKFEHDILALVYIGAAFLVIILGFRGLGEEAPNWMLDETTNKLHNWLIYTALIFEAIAIIILGLTMLFKPEENHNLSQNRKLPPPPTPYDLNNAINNLFNKIEIEHSELYNTINGRIKEVRNLVDKIDVNKLESEDKITNLKIKLDSLVSEIGKSLNKELNAEFKDLHDRISELPERLKDVTDELIKNILDFTNKDFDTSLLKREMIENEKKGKILKLFSDLTTN